MKKPSHKEKILKRLKKGKSINAIQALELFGCIRLAARIKELRNMGYAISSHSVHKNGKRYAEYTLEA